MAIQSFLRTTPSQVMRAYVRSVEHFRKDGLARSHLASEGGARMSLQDVENLVHKEGQQIGKCVSKHVCNYAGEMEKLRALLFEHHGAV